MKNRQILLSLEESKEYDNLLSKLGCENVVAFRQGLEKQAIEQAREEVGEIERRIKKEFKEKHKGSFEESLSEICYRWINNLPEEIYRDLSRSIDWNTHGNGSLTMEEIESLHIIASSFQLVGVETLMQRQANIELEQEIRDLKKEQNEKINEANKIFKKNTRTNWFKKVKFIKRVILYLYRGERR